MTYRMLELETKVEMQAATTRSSPSWQLLIRQVLLDRCFTISYGVKIVMKHNMYNLTVISLQ